MDLTILEISKIIGVSKRALAIKANKENWTYTIERRFGGKTKVFPFDSLPQEIKQKLFDIDKNRFDSKDFVARGKVIGESLVKTVRESESKKIQRTISGMASLAGYSQAIVDSIQGKIGLLRQADNFTTKNRYNKISGWKQFCSEFNQGNLVYDFLINPPKTISFSSLSRWEATLKAEGPIGLIDNRGKALKGTGFLDQNKDANNFCVALIYKFPDINASQLRQSVLAQFPNENSIPTISTFRKWLKKWKVENHELYISLYDPAGWKNKYMAAFGSMSNDAQSINEVWEFDSTPADVMLVEGRYSILAVIDVFTRRVKMVLKPTSSSMGIAELLRISILD